MMAFLRDSAHILLPIPVLEYKMSAQPHYKIQTAGGQYMWETYSAEWRVLLQGRATENSHQIFHNTYPMSTMAQRIANIFKQQVKCRTKTVWHYILDEQLTGRYGQWNGNKPQKFFAEAGSSKWAAKFLSSQKSRTFTTISK